MTPPATLGAHFIPSKQRQVCVLNALSGCLMHVVTPALSSSATSGVFIPSFTPSTYNYTVASTVDVLSFTNQFDNTVFACKALWVASNISLDCEDPSFESVLLSSDAQLLTLELYVDADLPPLPSTYSFFFQQQLCDVSALLPVDAGNIACLARSSFSAACVIQLPATTVTLAPTNNPFCTGGYVQLYTVSQGWTNCQGPCSINPGPNTYQFIASSAINSSQPVTIFSLSLSNGMRHRCLSSYVLTLRQSKASPWASPMPICRTTEPFLPLRASRLGSRSYRQASSLPTLTMSPDSRRRPSTRSQLTPSPITSLTRCKSIRSLFLCTMSPLFPVSRLFIVA